MATAIVLTLDADTSVQLPELSDELDPNIQRQSQIAAENMVIASLIDGGFPEDRIERVGHLKIGFDIRAHRVVHDLTGVLDVRRIEVKGRDRGTATGVSKWREDQTMFFLNVREEAIPV